MTEQTWIDASNGNADAIGILFSHLTPILSRWCSWKMRRSAVRRRHDPEDIAQIVMISLYKSLASGAYAGMEYEDFIRECDRIARNRVATVRNSENRKSNSVELEVHGESAEISLKIAAGTHRNHECDVDDADACESILARLRAVIVRSDMRTFLDMAANGAESKEIADKLGLSILRYTHVRTRFRRMKAIKAIERDIRKISGT